MGAIVSVGLIFAGELSDDFTNSIKQSLSTIDFSKFVLGILLSFLLFASSLHVKFHEIKSSAKSIFSFAILGTLLSTFLIGTAVYYLFPVFNINAPYITCLLFGSLISPTDPISVAGILKKANLSKSIEIKIVGESLFNDGIGVVLFATLLQISTDGMQNFSLFSGILLFIQEAIGGAVAGLVIGYIGFKMMKSIDNFQTEILISLAMVMGGYSLCNYLNISGPLAMVVAGLFTGNKGRREAMSENTRDYLGKFWEVIDNILNAILFMLIGLEIVIVSFHYSYIYVCLLTALLLILVRYASLWLPAIIFGFRRKLEKGTLAIMAWGGLRGGISIALVLSLTDELQKKIFVPITFIIVLFSILIQGFSIGRLINYFNRRVAKK